jgi:CHAD domain-containing protein
LFELHLDEGWAIEQAEQNHKGLHSLRKNIKMCRYDLEHLAAYCADGLKQPINDLKDVQDLLGNLHDIEVSDDYVCIH